MGTEIKVPELKLSMRDDEIKSRTKKMPNGEYATSICKCCGRYKTHPEGTTDDAKITTVCSGCFDKI